jgi:uncharacterized SAM-binding protein YcdF (DUF218 family)
MKNKLLPFILGLLCGSLLFLFLMGWALFKPPSWLVVQNGSHQADLGIVLGGGDGSRLRKGVELYDDGFISELLLVDQKADAWNYMLTHLCPDCDLEHKKITILSGSTNTMTDAQLTFAYCRKAAVRKVLVVTDPYHTRRASLVFQHRFRGSGIEVRVISSNAYRHLLSPEEEWWQDPATREVVWLEFGKCLHTLVTTYLFRNHE